MKEILRDIHGRKLGEIEISGEKQTLRDPLGKKLAEYDGKCTRDILGRKIGEGNLLMLFLSGKFG